MSDRVAVIGGDGAGSFPGGILNRAAQVVGRDHFPMPVTDATGLPIPTFPFGFDVFAFAVIFYLVKQWRLEIYLEWKVWNGSSLDTHSATRNIVWEPRVYEGETHAPDKLRDATRESDLVLSRTLEWGWDGVDGFGGDVPNIISDDSEDYPLDSFSLTLSYCDNAHFQDNKFWFETLINIVDGEFGNRANTWETALTRNVGNFTFQGQTTPLNAQALGVHGVGISACSVTIIPEQYWPCATSQGLPVYNTATGEPLNDPFS